MLVNRGQKHELVLKTLRILVAELCQQFKGGHPGGAIGIAAIGVALWRYTMRHAPHAPDWFNRDRFVLSNGHTCLLQYIFLHFSVYRETTFEQLKSYHSSREDSLYLQCIVAPIGARKWSSLWAFHERLSLLWVLEYPSTV